MALPTSSTSTPTMQGAAPTGVGDPPTPVLFEGGQMPIYLAKLYPDKMDVSEAAMAALEAGNSARDLGMSLKASQQEPIVVPDAEPPPPPPSETTQTTE